MRALTILFLGLALALPAAAEGFLDVVTGVASTQDDRARASGASFGSQPRLEFDDSPLLGVRGGFWGTGQLPFLGASFGISGFSPEGEGVSPGADLNVVPFSALILARLPLLTSAEFPKGQLQPYVGVGPSLVVSRLELDVPGGSDLEDTDVDLGVDFRAGLAVLLTRPVGLFAEYRLLHFDPTYDDATVGPVGGGSLDPKITTHFFQAGLTFRFGR